MHCEPRNTNIKRKITHLPETKEKSNYKKDDAIAEKTAVKQIEEILDKLEETNQFSPTHPSLQKIKVIIAQELNQNKLDKTSHLNFDHLHMAIDNLQRGRIDNGLTLIKGVMTNPDSSKEIASRLQVIFIQIQVDKLMRSMNEPSSTQSISPAPEKKYSIARLSGYLGFHQSSPQTLSSQSSQILSSEASLSPVTQPAIVPKKKDDTSIFFMS